MLYFKVCAQTTVLVWRSEDDMRELTLSFHHVDPRDWTVSRLGGGFLY